MSTANRREFLRASSALALSAAVSPELFAQSAVAPVPSAAAWDAGAVRHQDDGWRVLKDHAEDDVVRTHGAVDEHAGRAHAEIGIPLGHFGARIEPRTTLAKLDLQAAVAIESLLDRSVIARELELVFPLELQRDLIERAGRAYRRRGGACPPFSIRAIDNERVVVPRRTIWRNRSPSRAVTVVCHRAS